MSLAAPLVRDPTGRPKNSLIDLKDPLTNPTQPYRSKYVAVFYGTKTMTDDFGSKMNLNLGSLSSDCCIESDVHHVLVLAIAWRIFHFFVRAGIISHCFHTSLAPTSD